MERRDFMGALAAILCGVALPSERETLWLARERLFTEFPQWEWDHATPPILNVSTTDIDAALKELFMDPIINNVVPETVFKDLFADEVEPSEFMEQAHYFEVVR